MSSTPQVTLSAAVAAARNVDGRLEMFGVGTDQALWHIWQTVPHGGPWSAWASLGGAITSEPAVAVNTDGRLEVFARGTDNALWHIWQTVAHAGPWSAWASLGGSITSEPAVAVNTDGRLEAFARGTDHALWHIWQPFRTADHGPLGLRLPEALPAIRRCRSTPMGGSRRSLEEPTTRCGISGRQRHMLDHGPLGVRSAGFSFLLSCTSG